MERAILTHPPPWKIQSNVESTDHGVRSRLLTLTFDTLRRGDGEQPDDERLPYEPEEHPDTSMPPTTPLPPTSVTALGPVFETLISCLGPHLTKFKSDSERASVFINFLGQLLGRTPEREERIAAFTFDLVCYIYNDCTRLPLDYIIDWIANNWVAQTQRQIDDQEMADDSLGNFVRDINDCLFADVATNSLCFIWDNIMRRKFIRGVDPDHLVDGDYYAISVRGVMALFEHKFKEKNRYTERAINKFLRDSFNAEEPGRGNNCATYVQLADLTQCTIKDHYARNGGRMPECVGAEHLTAERQPVMLIHASVFKAKVEYTVRKEVRGRAEIIARFKRVVPTLYGARPGQSWEPSKWTPAEVERLVTKYEHTRAIGLDESRFPPTRTTTSTRRAATSSLTPPTTTSARRARAAATSLPTKSATAPSARVTARARPPRRAPDPPQTTSHALSASAAPPSPAVPSPRFTPPWSRPVARCPSTNHARRTSRTSARRTLRRSLPRSRTPPRRSPIRSPSAAPRLPKSGS